MGGFSGSHRPVAVGLVQSLTSNFRNSVAVPGKKTATREEMVI